MCSRNPIIYNYSHFNELLKFYWGPIDFSNSLHLDCFIILQCSIISHQILSTTIVVNDLMMNK